MPNITICESTGTLGLDDYPIVDEDRELVTCSDLIIPGCAYILDKSLVPT